MAGFSKVNLIMIIILLTFISRRVYNTAYTSVVPLGEYYFKIPYAGIAESLLYFSSILGTLLAGFLFYRKIYILSTILAFISSLMLIYKTLFFIGSFLFGFAFGIIIAYMLTITSFYGKSSLFLYSVSLGIASVVQPIIETFLLTFTNILTVFMISASFSFLYFLLSSIFIKFPFNSRNSLKLKINRGVILSSISIIVYVLPLAFVSTFIVIYAVSTFHISESLAYSLFIPFFISSTIIRYISAKYSIRNSILLIFQ
ncbi:hypothetical protein SJAV_07590 [Sulfurisphaera javensis]|uniref:Uncharacterized protein n=1 Tax=Sulfurisphaera javensis TaxID=2049879 RepID=A0AAT9GPF3_9CREN